MRKIIHGIVATALAAAGTLVSVTPASAAIGPCNQWNPDLQVSSGYCQGSVPSFFEQVIVCRFTNGYQYTDFGNREWAGGGVRSVVKCAAGSYRVDSWINTFE